MSYDGYGRPPKHNWESERDVLTALIDKCYGYKRISDRYGMTPVGIKRVLSRLGLATKRAEGGGK